MRPGRWPNWMLNGQSVSHSASICLAPFMQLSPCVLGCVHRAKRLKERIKKADLFIYRAQLKRTSGGGVGGNSSFAGSRPGTASASGAATSEFKTDSGTDCVLHE